MKVRYVMLFLILNTFFLALLSMYGEYLGIQQILAKLNYEFATSVETSLDMTLSSEEFFSSTSSLSSSTGLQNSIKILRGSSYDENNKKWTSGSWVSGNIYVMSSYFVTHKHFPESQSEYNSFETSFIQNSSTGTLECAVFEYIYGKASSDFNSPSLAWANPGLGLYVTDTSRRVCTPTFRSFVDAVGDLLTTTIYCKERNNNTYTIVEKTVPTLSQMGLRLFEENKVSSDITNENLQASLHRGKNGSEYYITPYSLGITYVDPRVLKSTLLANIENTVRFDRLGILPNDLTNENLASADGCIPTTVYERNITTPIKHRTSSESDYYLNSINSNMVNNGTVEYDMSSLKLNLDYYTIDFYDNSNEGIVNRIEGSVPYSPDFNNLPTLLKEKDTSTVKDGNRVVVKVTSTIDIQIPYTTFFLQWYRSKLPDLINHMGIRPIDDSTGEIDLVGNTLKYSYTTYRGISR